MRLIALAICVFIFAGISLAVSRLDLVALATELRIVEAPGLAFEVAPSLDQDLTTVTISRARPDGVMMLSDMASVQTAQFHMLQDAAVSSGVLKLRATTQISEGQNSVLRVLVGNQTRAEVLLQPGYRVIESDIGLTSDDLATEILTIRYVLVAPEDEGTCTQDGHAANVIEIEQDSHIALSIEDSALSNRDQVAAWGDEVLVGWPTWLSQQQREDRSTRAMQLAALGYNVRYVDAPDTAVMSIDKLGDLVTEGAPRSGELALAPQWPEAVGKSGANAGLRMFHKTTTWRHWYRIGVTHHVTAPSAFSYDIFLGPIPAGATWTIAMTHNGSVIDIREVQSGTGAISGRLSLVGATFEPSNVIEITATSNYEPVGLCNDGPQVFAELRPSSLLIGGGPAFDTGLADVRDALMRVAPVSIDVTAQLSLVEAQRMLGIADQLMQQGAEFVFDAEPPTVTAVRRRDLDDAIAAASSTDFVAWLDQSNRLVAVPALALQDNLDLGPIGMLALMIKIEENDRLSLVSDP